MQVSNISNLIPKSKALKQSTFSHTGQITEEQKKEKAQKLKDAMSWQNCLGDAIGYCILWVIFDGAIEGIIFLFKKVSNIISKILKPK